MTSPCNRSRRVAGSSTAPIAVKGRASSDLIDNDPSSVEALSAASQVEAPYAVAIFAGGGDRVIAMAFEIRKPGAKRASVVFAQVLDVAYFETRGFACAQRIRQSGRARRRGK